LADKTKSTNASINLCVCYYINNTDLAILFTFASLTVYFVLGVID